LIVNIDYFSVTYATTGSLPGSSARDLDPHADPR